MEGSEEVLTLGLVVLLAAAAVTDLKWRRIPNWLTAGGTLFALIWHFWTGGAEGLMAALEGLVLGIFLLLLPFLLGGMGAGDVKLLGMVGAFGGPFFVWQAFLGMALIGGVVAVLYLVAEGQLLSTLRRMAAGLVMSLALGKGGYVLEAAKKEEFRLFFPYGLAIALGSLAVWFWGW